MPAPEPIPAPAEARPPAATPEPPESAPAPSGPPTLDLSADARQAKKRTARQERLDKIKAMNDAELLAESAKRVAVETERLTRRNMKEAVAEHIQAKCRGNAAFTRLVMDPDKSMISCFQYRFMKKCAFYSSRDEQRVLDFFHEREYGGIAALVRTQQAILDERARKRQRKKAQNVRKRLECLPALPSGLATWAHLNIMPAYFIYDHARKGKASGTCTSCGQESTLTGVKHNAEDAVPIAAERSR